MKEGKNMTKRREKIISVILSIAMIVMMLPVISYGQETNTEIVEIISKRDQNSKTYQNTDGTYTKIITAEALHFEDNLGVWQEIDNRLENVDGVLQNIANSFTAKLPEMMNSETEVVLSKESNSIKIKTVGAIGSSLGNVLNNEEPKEKQQQIDYTNLWKTSSEVYYSDVYDSADIQYIVQPMGLKENIIIKNAPENQIWYEYEITAEGLVGEKKEDGSIEFYKNGNVEYVIPAPYMFDSSGKPEGESFDIDVEFIEVSDGKYRLTYTPSIEWLEDIDREYPVTLDPTLTTYQNINIVEDAYITDIVPDSNFGNDIRLYAHTYTYSGSTYNYEAYIKFDESIFTNMVEITSATLNMKYSTISTVIYSLYEVTSDWSEATLTWANKPSFNSSIVVNTSVSNQNWATFNVTNLLKKYGERNGNVDFYGFRIKGSPVSAYPPSLYLYSSENNTSYAPYLSITYKIDRVEQATNYWCWAACMQMLVQYNGMSVAGNTPMEQQETIYQYVFPNQTININKTATTQDIVNGLISFSSTVFGNASVENVTSANLNTIKSMINAGKIVIILAIASNNGIGHFLIVYKVDSNNNYYMIDPFYNSYNGIIVATQNQFLTNNFLSNAIGYCHAIQFISY